MGIVNHDIEMVREKCPAFEISKRESDYIFSGELILNHVFDDVRMTGKFNLEIVVPGDFPLAFPKVKELSNCINSYACVQLIQLVQTTGTSCKYAKATGGYHSFKADKDCCKSSPFSKIYHIQTVQ